MGGDPAIAPRVITGTVSQAHTGSGAPKAVCRPPSRLTIRPRRRAIRDLHHPDDAFTEAAERALLRISSSIDGWRKSLPHAGRSPESTSCSFNAPAALALGLRARASHAQGLSFQGADFYPEIEDKAAALGYFIISGHPFVDGNKRVGHAAMEVLLLLNNRRLDASVDDSERIVLEIANGRCSRDQLAHWLRAHTSPISTESP
jgi:death-on-curing protein